MSNKNQNKIKNTILQLIFNGFPYVQITYLMIFAASFHGSGTSDVLSTGYLLIAMYYIVNFRKLFTKNYQMLKFLRGYNLAVLFIVVMFQTPLFICPSAHTLENGINYMTR